MKKILIFSLAYFPKYVAGAEVATKEITDRISPDEIEFDMLTCRFDSKLPKNEKIGNVNVYRVGFGSTFDKFIFPILGTIETFRLYNYRKYDSFWVMMATFSSGSAYIFNIIRGIFGFKKIPIILTLQEGDSESHIKSRRFGLIGLSWKLALKRTAHLTVISKYLEGMARKYGYKKDVSIIPNGVDFDFFSTPKLDKEKFLINKLNKTKDDVFLITTSRLVLKNDVGSIIESLQYLASNVKLLILGQGDEEKKLKEKVAEMKLSERVKFLGYIEHKDLPQYLHISDIFIRPALSEGFGISYVEAMAAQVPVIATPVGGIVDFLKEGETGLFCEVKNPKSIAQKVEKFLKDKESRDFIVKNASQMVREKYDWNLIAKDMKNEVFLRVL